MQTKKLSGFKNSLSRDQMGKIKGGSNTCCMHNANNSVVNCSYATQGDAHAAADAFAEQYGGHWYYCCQCQSLNPIN